jgi:hypothetical protein
MALRRAVVFEAILVATLLLAHLAVESQSLKAFEVASSSVLLLLKHPENGLPLFFKRFAMALAVSPIFPSP